MTPGKGPQLIYSTTVRKIITGLALACVVVCAVFGSLDGPRNAGFVWALAGVAAVALLTALVTPRNPKRDTGLFLVAGLSGGVFFGASGFGFPQNIPAWIWVTCSIGLATMALVTDADAAQNKSTSRL
jgi:hypothetical protein